MTGNSSTHPKDLAHFIQQMRSRHDATSSAVPISNGLEWPIKL